MASIEAAENLAYNYDWRDLEEVLGTPSALWPAKFSVLAPWTQDSAQLIVTPRDISRDIAIGAIRRVAYFDQRGQALGYRNGVHIPAADRVLTRRLSAAMWPTGGDVAYVTTSLECALAVSDPGSTAIEIRLDAAVLGTVTPSSTTTREGGYVDHYTLDAALYDLADGGLLTLWLSAGTLDWNAVDLPIVAGTLELYYEAPS